MLRHSDPHFVEEWLLSHENEARGVEKVAWDFHAKTRSTKLSRYLMWYTTDVGQRNDSYMFNVYPFSNDLSYKFGCDFEEFLSSAEHALQGCSHLCQSSLAMTVGNAFVLSRAELLNSVSGIIICDIDPIIGCLINLMKGLIIEYYQECQRESIEINTIEIEAINNSV